MSTPEEKRSTSPHPTVSVLVTTYNRSALLKRALASVLKQDFTDFEIVVVDDHSSDDTPLVMEKFDDPRIRYVRHEVNLARKWGDRSIFQRFVEQQARGEFFLWLCDDDYWLPQDLLSRQVSIMRAHSNVVMVFGGMAQLYPSEADLPIPNEPYLRYEYVGNARSITFARNVFPDGLLSSEAFLDLFADDPKNRNNVTGGTMFRTESFRGAGALKNGTGVRWQSGYLMLAGTATMGDVWYIDDPCVVATVELESASYRGTQHDHMCDCLRSIDAAFMNALGATHGVRARRLAFIRLKMMHGVFQTYLANKISFRLGGFQNNPLKGIDRIFEEEITGPEFRAALGTYDVPLSWRNRMAIVLSALPGTILRFLDRVMRRFLRAPPNWWKFLIRFPSHTASTIVSARASIKSDVFHA